MLAEISGPFCLGVGGPETFLDLVGCNVGLRISPRLGSLRPLAIRLDLGKRALAVGFLARISIFLGVAV